MRASPLPEHGARPFWAFGWSSGLQHFLPCGQQNLHITTCGSLGPYLYFNVHSALVPKLHCVSGGDAKNDDPVDCSAGVVSARWWGVGIFSLARVAPAVESS